MDFWGNVKKLAIILLGNFLYALAVAFFILPAGLITGGTTGIALFVQHFTRTDLCIFLSFQRELSIPQRFSRLAT